MRTRILVTGGAGFIGSNFVRYLVKRHPHLDVVVLDSFTYAGHRSSLDDVIDEIFLIDADITNPAAVKYAMYGCDMVVHFAAETHVDRSIVSPARFLETNILGTEILLRYAKKFNVSRFHHVSTDEVFGELGFEDKPFNENSPYNPRSPYAASKAASDHLVRAYGETYGLPYTITNCSNNYGPYQTPEKIIPLFITNALDGKKLPIYGDGLSVRDYLFVEDHCKAIDMVLHYGINKDTFCVGGSTEKNGLQVAKFILNILGLPDDMVEYVPDRLGHDRRYAIDSSLLQEKLGWKPESYFPYALEQTVDWYVTHQDWWRPIKKNLGT